MGENVTGYLVSLDGMRVQRLSLQSTGTPDMYYGIPDITNHYTMHTHTLGVDFFKDEKTAYAKALEYIGRYKHSIQNLLDKIEETEHTYATRR